jgi:hypothetical protein
MAPTKPMIEMRRRSISTIAHPIKDACCWLISASPREASNQQTIDSESVTHPVLSILTVHTEMKEREEQGHAGKEILIVRVLSSMFKYESEEMEKVNTRPHGRWHDMTCDSMNGSEG